MSDGDKYQGEAGFVDALEPYEDSADDTVCVSAYVDPKESHESEGTDEESPPKTQVVLDVSDLNWTKDDESVESYAGDAPLASPVEGRPLGREDASSRRSDFFDRGLGDNRKAFFGPQDVQPKSQGAPQFGRGHSIPKGLTVSELARQAEQTRRIISDPRSPGKFQAVQERVSDKHAATRAKASLGEASPRSYPKMLSLLQSPEDAMPEPVVPEPAPPVPGTFFPTKKKHELVPDEGPPDVDGLLSAMAEGLLVGEGPDGSSQIMVTLSDEFFRGTELRVAVDTSGVTALLLPPDYEVYRHLSSQIHRLEERLRHRGLNVTKVTVQRP